jgi:hypothetical protein
VPRREPTLSGAIPSRRHGLDGHHCCAGISAGVAALIGDSSAVHCCNSLGFGQRMASSRINIPRGMLVVTDVLCVRDKPLGTGETRFY